MLLTSEDAVKTGSVACRDRGLTIFSLQLVGTSYCSSADKTERTRTQLQIIMR